MGAIQQKTSLRRPVVAGLAIALISGVVVFAGASVASGQEAADCRSESMGSLGATTENVLRATGRWTTSDCESRFRPGSDAHTFTFEVHSPGRVRIELTSAEADPYLYLMAADGTRITDDDDGGSGLAARIERDLIPGVYLLEATTVGGRGRGAADFTLTVGRVAGCGIGNLGVLLPGADLIATGSWSLDTCGSRIVSSHPAYNYSFILPADGRVRIELVSDNGDPVLSLASLGRVIGANDDGAGAYNSRIEQHLPAGLYFIEATTYLARDLQPLRADFTLTVHLVDEVSQQQNFNLKVEQVHLPSEVIAGDSTPVNYRVGNIGGGDLPGGGNTTYVYAVGRVEGGQRSSDFHGPVAGPGGRWPAGASYHSDASVGSATSVANSAAAPLEITYNNSGPAWLFVGIFTDDANGDEIGFQGVWHNLTVLSGPVFEPVEVEVDGTTYRVSAAADEHGAVTTSVRSVTDPAVEAEGAARAEAIYTAGVHTQLLEGLFDRPAVVALGDAAGEDTEPQDVIVPNPSSGLSREAFGARYAAAVEASGLAEVLADAEAIDPSALQATVRSLGESAVGEYAPLAASWDALLERSENGEALSLGEAVALQSQLAYAESVLAPAATAARIVAAADEATLGWDDPEVAAMASELGDCDPGESALGDALEAAGADVEGLTAIDAELRAVLPLWGQAADSALCAVAALDDGTVWFLQRLGIDASDELSERLALGHPPAAEPAPTYGLRVIARLGADGRIEHAVELDDGRRVLPDRRYLRADAPVDKWRSGSSVELDGALLGTIRSRRLDDGRVELGFVDATDEAILPDIRYLPADLPEGVWYRSSQVQVTAEPGN